MITIYNSNLDFDLDSSNSITLSSTSNMVFKTNGSDKLTIQNNGISVSGNVVVSGLITSTGAGFSGIGAGLSNIPISAINELRLELNGGTTELSVTRDTLNASILSEARFGSNYTNRINSELNTRVDNTSNYVLATSNILIGRIINTSNYVDSTSNFLAVRIDNTSNYALATSNILIGRIINTSNYVDSTSNFLSGRIDNTSNYALATSNILIGRIINTSNYVDSTSNFLGGRIDNTSNYALATSNILIGRIINTCNYVESTSNTLIGRIINASNYVESTSNILIGRIINASNYTESTSNTLIGRIINTSNYVDSTSNFLSGRIDNTSNYALATSNILIGRIINTSNYVDSTSNILIGRIINTSNYVESTSNILIGRIINTSNYVDSTSNFLARRIDNASSWGSNYTDKADIWGSNYSDRVGGWGSNYAYDKVGVWSSNYTDRVGGWGSNYAYDKVGVWGSNYAYDKVGVWSSNYTDRVGVWGSNYAYDKVGAWSSNYTDRVGGWGSNYAYDKVGMYSSNYTDRIGERTSNYVFATSNILIGRIINTSNYVSSYKPATAVTADFANRFTNSVNIAGVPFNGTANISISYNSLDNQLSFGNGLSTSYDNITKITSVTANAAPQEQSDWTQTSISSASFIKNKPTIPANTFQLNGSIAFYNSGNVGIGTNAPLSLLEIITANYTGALLTLDAGVVNSTTQMPRSIGRPLLKLGKTSYSTSAGDYYGIGFGISPTLSDYNCAEIGTIITSTSGLETGDIIFSTRPGTNNVIATERMRITSGGNVGIGVTDTSTYKLNVGGTLNTTGLFVNGTAFTGNNQWIGTTDIYNNTGKVGIGTNTGINNILQVGSGARLRISNATTDYSLIGTNDIDGTTNTKIVIYGNDSIPNNGNILYISTSTGSHIFSSGGGTERMRIASNGNVGIGTTDTATYKLNVGGSINATSLSVNGSAITIPYANISSIPATWADSQIPTLAISKTSGLQTALDGKASSSHTHPISAITSLQTALDGKASSSHTHPISDITSLQTTLDGKQAKIWETNGANIYYNSGFVGIGTSTTSSNDDNTSYTIPDADLYIKGGNSNGGTCNVVIRGGSVNTNNGKARLWFLSNNSHSSYIESEHSGNGLTFLRFATSSSNDLATENLRINPDGALIFKQSVWHLTYGDTYRRFYFTQSGETIISGGNGVAAANIVIQFRSASDDVTLALLTRDGTLKAYAFASISDRRIKKDIEDINDETALNKLLLIQPKTYNYVDEMRNKGFGKVYGFIAQQIREVIPEATTISSGIIPNIYKKCLIYNKREIYHSIPVDVDIDTEVLITINNVGGRYKIKEIYEDYFVIDKDIDADEVFVFGYNVDDFHAIDKNYIFTLNVCATQELHRRMEAQNERIKDLEAKIDRLLNS